MLGHGTPAGRGLKLKVGEKMFWVKVWDWSWVGRRGGGGGKRKRYRGKLNSPAKVDFLRNR